MARAMEMSQQSITEYTEKMRGRYQRRTGKQARSKLLDEYVEVNGCERKHANKILRNQRQDLRMLIKQLRERFQLLTLVVFAEEIEYTYLSNAGFSHAEFSCFFRLLFAPLT